MAVTTHLCVDLLFDKVIKHPYMDVTIYTISHNYDHTPSLSNHRNHNYVLCMLNQFDVKHLIFKHINFISSLGALGTDFAFPPLPNW